MQTSLCDMRACVLPNACPLHQRGTSEIIVRKTPSYSLLSPVGTLAATVRFIVQATEKSKM